MFGKGPEITIPAIDPEALDPAATESPRQALAESIALAMVRAGAGHMKLVPEDVARWSQQLAADLRPDEESS